MSASLGSNNGPTTSWGVTWGEPSTLWSPPCPHLYNGDTHRTCLTRPCGVKGPRGSPRSHGWEARDREAVEWGSGPGLGVCGGGQGGRAALPRWSPPAG